MNRNKPSRLRYRMVQVLAVVVGAAAATAAVLVLTRPMCTGPPKATLAKSEMQTLRTAVMLFQAEKPGICPTLHILVRAGYLDTIKDGGTDPWGSYYRIQCTDTETDVISAGPDRRMNTEDDVRLSAAR